MSNSICLSNESSMTEWMIKLERAKELLDAGALTQDEFDREKARLLSKSRAAPLDSPTLDDGCVTPSNLHWRWITVGTAIICLGAIVYFFVWLNAPPANEPSPKTSIDSSSLITSQPDSLAPVTETLKLVELAATLKFSSPSQCTAMGALEEIYQKLERANDSGAQSLSIKLEEFEMPLLVSVSSNNVDDGWLEKDASIKFPRQARWNGLRISRIRKQHLVPPYVGGVSVYNIITFYNSPLEVQSVLNGIGVSVPIDPDYSELGGNCGQVMSVAAVPGGAAFSCNWWC